MVDMSKRFCVLIAGLAIMSYTAVGLAAPEIIAEGKTAAVKAEAIKDADKAADIKKAAAIPEAAKAVAEGKTAAVETEAIKDADKAEEKTAAIETAKEKAEIQYGAEPKIKSDEKEVKAEEKK
ncbi:MAG: hypothetical protein V3V70_02800 [Candidatus Scalindua sp.]